MSPMNGHITPRPTQCLTELGNILAEYVFFIHVYSYHDSIRYLRNWPHSTLKQNSSHRDFCLYYLFFKPITIPVFIFSITPPFKRSSELNVYLHSK